MERIHKREKSEENEEDRPVKYSERDLPKEVSAWRGDTG
jgi:hypothetical protein